ncbi:MAG: GGDEF domain-containing protein, partial [Magnetovibrio sp.]|nr:GGDEF domain-containing protein [Magnetovibrio sp.]
MGRRVIPYLPFIGFAVVFLVALSFWTVGEPNFSMRAGIVSTYLTFFNVFTLHALWPRHRDEDYVFAKLIGALMALNMVKNIIHLGVVVGGVTEGGILDSGPNSQFMYASAIATVMLMAMGYIALITEYLHKDLREQAERDSLTGAYNRRAFYGLAAHILKRHQRDGGAVSLIMLDLDHFKAVNDTHGHIKGDEVLKRTVGVAQGLLRGQDVLVRLGGEEFA